MTLNPLLPLLYEPIVQTALREDLGRAGDITADAIVPAGQKARLVVRARQSGVVAGLDVARSLADQSARALPHSCPLPSKSAVPASCLRPSSLIRQAMTVQDSSMCTRRSRWTVSSARSIIRSSSVSA